jgi:hypothetical protein
MLLVYGQKNEKRRNLDKIKKGVKGVYEKI